MSSAGKKFLLFAFFLATVLCGSRIALAEAEASRPRRIVSINLCTDELLLQLVAPERVAALTKFSADPEVSRVASRLKDVKRIPSGIEDIQACGPDLLLGGTINNRETLRFFVRSGIPVLTFKIPKNFEDIYADIRKLAAAVGETGKGEAIIRQMQDELEGVRRLFQKRGQSSEGGRMSKKKVPDPFTKRAVFFQSGGLVPGAGTFENAIMEAAGLENLAAAIGIQDYGSLSLEEMIKMKPDVLIFSSEQKQKPTVRGEVLDHPAIRRALPRVKTVTIPSAILNCGSPASIEAVRILVREALK